jgi:hypothetical protein
MLSLMVAGTIAQVVDPAAPDIQATVEGMKGDKAAPKGPRMLLFCPTNRMNVSWLEKPTRKI